MIDTAGTISLASQALIDAGATEVYACCTHPILSGPAIERIEASPIKTLVVTDSINFLKKKLSTKWFKFQLDHLSVKQFNVSMKMNLSVHCSIHVLRTKNKLQIKRVTSQKVALFSWVIGINSF